MNRESLILKYKKDAERTAYSYFWKKNVPEDIKDDVCSMAYLGLIKAVDTYDNNKAATLQTHIRNKVYHTIAQEIRDNYDFLTRYTRYYINQLNKIEQEYIKVYNCKPNKETLRKEFNKRITGCSNRKFNTDQTFKRIYRLKELQHCDIDLFANALYDDVDLEQVCSDMDLICKLKNLIADLPENERYCLKRYFFDETMMKDIGKEINRTEGRVSQLIISAVKRLRKGI